MVSDASKPGDSLQKDGHAPKDGHTPKGGEHAPKGGEHAPKGGKFKKDASPRKNQPDGKQQRQRPGFKPKGKGFQKTGRERKYPREALEIARQTDMPIRFAVKVANKELSLEKALEENREFIERRKKGREICEKYKKISFSLACLLVKQGTSPEDYLVAKKNRENEARQRELQKKKRMEQDKPQEKAYQALVKFCENKTNICLEQYNKQTTTGSIEDFTPYDFYFVSDKGMNKIHRLAIKYFYEQEASSFVKRMVFIDQSIGNKKLRPSYGPEGRYQFPEPLLKEGNEIIMALHEGEMVRGKIIWFTPYDILLQMGKYQVWVLRHAVMDCTLAKRVPQK